jgi:hypothetical protein
MIEAETEKLLPKGYFNLPKLRRALEQLRQEMHVNPDAITLLDQLDAWLTPEMRPLPSLTNPAALAKTINTFHSALASDDPELVRLYATTLFRLSAATMCGVYTSGAQVVYEI